MRARLGPVLAVTVLFAVACSTAPSGSAGMSSGCHAGPKWATGDSITKGVLGIAGWPNQPPAAGHYTNLGVGAASIGYLANMIETDLASCDPGDLPQEVVIAAGLIDLVEGDSLATMESEINSLASTISVPLRIVSVAPIPLKSKWSIYDAQRREYNAYLAATFPSQYIDCQAPLAGPDGYLNPAYDEDGLAHLTNAGSSALAQCVYDADV
jgi:hypothetical protein